MHLSNTTIGFIGAGNMGQSMIQGLLNQEHPPKHIWVCDHHTDSLKKRLEGPISYTQSPLELVDACEAVILAVKPQGMAQVLQAIKGFDVQRAPLIVSIAAGITTSQLRKPLDLSLQYPLARVMPNTPALIQSGASGLYCACELPKEQKQLCENIAGAIGEWVWVAKESQMDIVTALSGSGPAYFFLFMEELIKSAVELGLPQDTAQKLCFATGLGAIKMAQQSSDTLEQLRTKVTSKGGTTEAAIDALMDDQFGDILFKALSKATQRGKELSESLETTIP